MKKKSISTAILFMVTLFAASFSIADERCGIADFTHKMIKDHPEIEQSIESAKIQLEEESIAFAKNAKSRLTAAGPIIVPVVVHVIHANGPENIPDAKVIEGIQQVNEDFKMQNADPALIHPNFQGMATDTKMAFRLAKLDPNGNPTNGITRTYNPSWSANGALDEPNMKLKLGWPQNKYLNIYVVTSAYGGGSSAYAYYPSSVQPPYEHYDGVIISAWAYGRTTPGYYTVLSHEIGHWANLIHTWGDQVGVGLSTSCGIDDLVADTPNCIGTSGTLCNENTTTCGSLDNNENFMDYGKCQTMFTTGQVTRLHAAMNSSIGRRNEIWTQSNLIATGVYENNYSPTAKINGEYYGTNGLPVTFSSQGSFDTDGTIASYTWRFGDGGTSTASNPTHTYAAPGEFQVSLTVTDNGGKATTATTTAYITSPGTYIDTETEPNDYFNTANGVVGPGAFPVTGTFTGSGDSDYFQFTIARPGKIRATLTATDPAAKMVWQLFHESDLLNPIGYPANDGASVVGECEATKTGKYYLVCYMSSAATTSYELDVLYPGNTLAGSNKSPVANANGPYSGSVNSPINFSSTGSSDPDGTITAYAWDFGNGGKSTAANPSHTYGASGTFTVTLTVTDNKGATATATAIVTVTGGTNKTPVPNANGPYAGKVNTAVTFSSSGSSDPDGTITAYEWNFGDGATSTSANPTHTYTTAGTYTVTLKITDNLGATGTATTKAKIEGTSTNITTETEPNDSSTTANGPVDFGINVSGRLSAASDKDWYYIDVSAPRTFTIDVNMASPTGVNWLLYHESNMSSYLAYPTNGLNGSINATKPGRYYLTIYTWTAGDRPYTLSVK